MSGEVLATTHDPDGNEVVLDDAGWAHILEDHPELRQSREAIMTVPPNADHRRRDLHYQRREWYYRSGGFGPTNWLAVLVDYEVNPARIVTSFGLSDDPPGWIWERA